MATTSLKLCVFLTLITTLAIETKAQSSSCTNALMTMSPCLRYTSGNSSRPSSSCCSALSNVIQTNPQCLCSVINSSGATSILGMVINQTLATSLPSACRVQTPPLIQCQDGGTAPSPSAEAAVSPTSSVAAPSADSPMANSPAEEEPQGPTSDLPTGSGSNTVPSTLGNTSDGTSITKSAIHFLALLLPIVLCTSYGAAP